MAALPPENCIPPLTAYFVMKVGRLPLVPYYRPGDHQLAVAVGALAADHHALLLANHGPIVSGISLDSAVYAIEELEETAKIFLLLYDKTTRPLGEEQVSALESAFRMKP
jgi:ribulose-5-phosphate 4-epimerase/fuculose-1-phosphate aldolase